jgi:hypothetical protein
MKTKSTVKNKLVKLSFVYAVPLIFAIIFTLVKTIEINGVDLNGVGLAAIGFLFGLFIDGLLIIAGVTFGILSGAID